jgi:2-polyprenyl-3-methyl-5-hydroxy-6-metoxy-1,4-benzoquinol methylase
MENEDGLLPRCFMSRSLSTIVPLLASLTGLDLNNMSVNCKICNSTRLIFVAHTAKCKDCGVLMYYPFQDDTLFVSKEDPASIAESKSLFRDWYRRSAFLNHSNFTKMFLFAIQDPSRVQEGIKILDYGAGGGQFALICKSFLPSCEVYTVDVNDYGLLDEYQPLVHQIKWKDFSTDTTRFDYIFLNDVYEHLSDPIKTMTLLGSKLKDDGALFIDTPKQFWIYSFFKFLSQKMYLRLLKGTVSVAHLQIWTPKSFRLSMQQSGFQVVRYREQSEFTMNYNHYLRNMGITGFLGQILGTLFYRSAKYLAKNKIMALVSKSGCTHTSL